MRAMMTSLVLGALVSASVSQDAAAADPEKEVEKILKKVPLVLVVI